MCSSVFLFIFFVPAITFFLSINLSVGLSLSQGKNKKIKTLVQKTVVLCGVVRGP